MVQVTSKPRESIEISMGEDKRVKETPGGTGPGQQMPELHTIKFDWPGLQIGPGPEIMVFKPNQRSRPGEIPQGMQQVPAIWLTPPRGAPWHYSGLNDNGLANGQPVTSSSLGWHGSKHIFACGALIVLLLMVMRYVDRYWPMLRFRTRRVRSRAGLQVTCQLRQSDEMKIATSYASESDESFNGRDKPPSYFENADTACNVAPRKMKSCNGRPPPYSCIFTTGKGKVPRLHVFDARRDRKLMEKMGIKKYAAGESSASGQVTFNVPGVNVTNPKDKQHIVIEINDKAHDSGCVIGLDVLLGKNGNDGIIPKVQAPLDLTVEKLNINDEKPLEENAKE